MTNIKILIACHKPDKIYQDDIYTPIQVGKAISKYNLNFIGDDTYDNISTKNPMYCELTAQYWAWKNIKDVDYIGLCHYRRYFETKITTDNIDKLLGKHHDVILPKPIIERRSMGWHLLMTSCAEDVYIFMNILKRMYPNYYTKTAEPFLNSNIGILYNMFVMNKRLFDEFAEWQFSILNEMEKSIKLSNYTRMRRVYGYVGEMLLPIWCKHNNLRIKYDYIVPMIGEKHKNPIGMPLRKAYNKLTFSLVRQPILTDPAAVKVGLQNDGIII